MNAFLGHSVLSSVKEYFTYRLLKDAAAYSNQNVTLYNYSDNKWTNKYVYGSPFAQFVYHSGVSGPTMCSGIYHPGFVPKGTGLYVDHRNGRVISSSALTGTVTANVSISDVNTYVTTYSDYQLVAETNYLTLPSYKSATGYLEPDSNVLSALFFRMSKTNNSEIGFGGLNWSTYHIKVTAAMKNNYHLSMVADLVRDAQTRIIPILSQTPLNEYNDVKAGWNYANYLASPGSSYMHVQKASFAHFENDVLSKNNPMLEVGLGDLVVQAARVPLQEYP